jgi:hypothetical protein
MRFGGKLTAGSRQKSGATNGTEYRGKMLTLRAKPIAI